MSGNLVSAKPPELLAPAGDRDCARAAVENGADAVYFGLDSGFNARARATNFQIDELEDFIGFLHRRGVKGYLTLNTLAFTDELDHVEESIRKIAAAGVDAVLIQDVGVAELVRKVAPTLGRHASTQMTLTSGECIQAVADLGLERIVLPRELSVSEVRQVAQNTDVPLEVFVHGALCVAYSGQCLTSESLGGRSANRGQCAQACRLPYEVIRDGKDVELGDQKYLLSPQDLAGFDLVAELIDAGVRSFKIEGRLKTPEYVANTVRHYREAIDAAVGGCPAEFSRQQINDLEMSFSRGLSPGWLQGCDHKMLVPGLSSSKRGVLLGEVVEIFSDRVAVRLSRSVAAGDGVVFEGDREAGTEQGGRIFGVFLDGHPLKEPADDGVVELTFGRDVIDFDRLQPGLQIWKTDDPKLNRRLRSTFEGPDANRRVDVDLVVEAAPGSPLRLEARATNGASCRIESDQNLETARKHPLSADVLREQLSRLGATVYKLRNLDARIDGQPMAPLSVLGQLRRRLIAELDSASVTRPHATAEHAVLPELRRRISEFAAAAPSTASQDSDGDSIRLSVLCRSLDQLKAVTAQRPERVYVDFADIRQYREACDIGRELDVPVWPATPRIQKPGEMGIFAAMEKHQPAGVLSRNLAGLAYFSNRDIPVVADFSFNATNELTVDFLIRHGAERVTASYDMNRDQLLDLCTVTPPHWLEVVIHQHMPMFHMEHCVFCAVLSPGTNKTNCGRPCDFHQVELRDRIGLEHPLTADVGCRNTLFNATPQSSAEAVASLLQNGIRDFRIELLRDGAKDVEQTLNLYRRLLDGTISGQDVWRDLKASNRVGVTRGTLEERRNPLAIL